MLLILGEVLECIIVGNPAIVSGVQPTAEAGKVSGHQRVTFRVCPYLELSSFDLVPQYLSSGVGEGL